MLLPASLAHNGLIYVDVFFDVNKYKVGVWGPTIGHGGLQGQEAEMEALVCGASPRSNMAWLVFHLVGDNWGVNWTNFQP